MICLVNHHGVNDMQVRLAKWYSQYSQKEKTKLMKTVCSIYALNKTLSHIYLQFDVACVWHPKPCAYSCSQDVVFAN